MNTEEWMEHNVLCPICGERFKDTTYLGFLFTPPVVMCRVCAEHFAEKSCYSGLLFVPWKVKG